MYIKKGLPKQDGNGNRLYFARGIYVSKNGKTIYNLQDNSSYPHYYKPHPDKNGRLYITNDGDRLYVDELVAACYLPKPPNKDRYKLKHKDGNIQNNYYSNLQWEQQVPSPSVGQCVSGYYLIDDDGKVFDEDKEMRILDHLYDSDLELFDTVAPYFYDNYGNRVHLDDVIEAADGFVSGNKETLKKPSILHKNHDRLDYSRNNLQWVESDSQEYQDYLMDYWKWEYENNIKINPGKRFPDFMQPKI